VRYFEDYQIGQIIEVGTHQITREEIIDFAAKWDPQPFHLDDAAAAASIFGGLTASGCHLVALTIRLIMRSEARGQVLAAAGWDEVRFPHPVRPDDVLTLTVECRLARPSRSKGDRGIIKNLFTLRNQQGRTVLQYSDTIFVQRRHRP